MNLRDYKTTIMTMKEISEAEQHETREPNLGCATTRELLEEIKARIEVDGNLDYRTIDAE